MPALDRRKTAGWRSRASARRGWRRSACRRRTIPRESPACPVAEHIAGARQPSRPMPVVTRAGSRFRRRSARQAGPATPLGGPARDARERESLVGVDAGAGAQSSRRFLASGPAGSRPTARRGRRLQRPARGADDGATDGCVQRLVDGLSNAVESAPYLLPEEDPPESTLCTYRQRARGTRRFACSITSGSTLRRPSASRAPASCAGRSRPRTAPTTIRRGRPRRLNGRNRR